MTAGECAEEALDITSHEKMTPLIIVHYSTISKAIKELEMVRLLSH